MNAMTVITLVVVLGLAIGVRQIRRLNRDVAALFAMLRALNGTTPPAEPAETETRLRTLEAAERRRQQANAERSLP